MIQKDPFEEAEKNLRKADKVQKALREESSYLQEIKETIKQDSDQDEIKKIHNSLK